MRSLSDYYNSAADTVLWFWLWWEVIFTRWLIATNELERDSTSCKEVRAYLTERIAEHQAYLDRLYINNLPLIERRMKGQTA